ncbi:MAG: hypothetical protein LUG98_07710 [Tannerellaceae bacterium]|nr:hypothetical protein [Tannerellaceae bacterium]
MEKDSGVFFRDLKDKVTEYAELKVEYYKLSSYEVLGKATGKLSYGLILILTGIGALFFFLLSVGFFLGDLLGSYGLGFLCVTILFVLVLGLVVLSKNAIRNFVINRCLTGISKLEKEIEDGNNADDIPGSENTAGEIVLTETGDQTAD